MAVFIDLWPCLFTTKLSYAQLFKWGHSTLSIAENIFFAHERTFILTRVYWIIMQQIYFILGKILPCMPFLHYAHFWFEIFTYYTYTIIQNFLCTFFWHTVVQKYVHVEKKVLGLNDPLTIRFLAGVKRERRKVLVSSKMTNLCRSKNPSIAYFIIQIIPISLWLKIRKRLVFMC